MRWTPRAQGHLPQPSAQDLPPSDLNSRQQPGVPRWAVYAGSGGKAGVRGRKWTLVLASRHATGHRGEAEKGIALEVTPETEF